MDKSGWVVILYHRNLLHDLITLLIILNPVWSSFLAAL